MSIYDIDGNRIDGGGGDGTDIISVNDPDRTLEKLQQLNRATRTSGGANAHFGTTPLCLIHFSDIHGDGHALQRIVDYKTHYDSYIVDIIHSGDIVKGDSSDGIAFWENINGAKYILNCIGNHDSKNNNGWTGLTAADCYTTYFNPFIANWNVTIGSNVCYYYKDYSSQKVRLIVLDAMHQDSTQLQWFINTLDDARTNGFDVIAVSHVYPYKKNTIPSNEPWDATQDWNKTDGRLGNDGAYPAILADDYAVAVNAFQENDGQFICWLNGHLHRRLFRTLYDYPNQLVITVTNGGDKYASNPSCERVQNTKTEDCFNVIAVDTYQKILRGISVGANIDRFMRGWNEFCYDYNLHTLITSR